MRMSDKGMLALIRRESLVLSTYLDSKRIPTIGVGHTAHAGEPLPKAGLKITPAEGMAIFRKDLAKYEADVRRAVKVPLAQHEFDALVSFHFNTGGIARASLTKALNAGDKARAGHLFMMWTKPVEVTDRRRDEQRQFLTGNYGPIARVPVQDKHPGRKRMVPAAELLGHEVAPKPPKADPFNPAPREQPPVVAPVPQPRPLTKTEIEAFQGRLRELGYVMVGEIDGRIGGRTRAAITAFQEVNGLPVTAEFDDATRAALDSGGRPMEVSPERAQARPEDIAAKVPEVAEAKKTGLIAKVQAWGAAIGAAVYGAKDYVVDAVETLRPVKDAIESVPTEIYVLAIATLAIVVWWQNRRTEAATVEAYRTGART